MEQEFNAFDNRDELQKKAQKAVWDKNADRRKAQMKSVMASKDGRAFIAMLFQVLNFREEVINDNSSKTSYLLGRRSVAVQIFRDIKNYNLYDLYQLMEKEDIEQQKVEAMDQKKIVEQFNKGR